MEAKCHQLYRFFDKDNTLLYIGISLSAVARMNQHKYQSSWYSKAKTLTIENFKTRQECDIAETIAINLESPLHNIAKVNCGVNLQENCRELSLQNKTFYKFNEISKYFNCSEMKLRTLIINAGLTYSAEEIRAGESKKIVFRYKGSSVIELILTGKLEVVHWDENPYAFLT